MDFSPIDRHTFAIEGMRAISQKMKGSDSLELPTSVLQIVTKTLETVISCTSSLKGNACIAFSTIS